MNWNMNYGWALHLAHSKAQIWNSKLFQSKPIPVAEYRYHNQNQKLDYLHQIPRQYLSNTNLPKNMCNSHHLNNLRKYCKHIFFQLLSDFYNQQKGQACACFLIKTLNLLPIQIFIMQIVLQCLQRISPLSRGSSHFQVSYSLNAFASNKS